MPKTNRRIRSTQNNNQYYKMKNRIYLSSPHMSQEGFEKQYIEEAFATNWIAPLGPNVDAFETEFAEKVGVGQAAALSSGTAALHLALLAAGVGGRAGGESGSQKDVVFCQSLTFSATANPIIYCGATPVFIDSDLKTWNMDPVALKKAFEKYAQQGQLPKAVIVVHLYGLAADLDPILELCQNYGTILIEDAAESLGTSYKTRQTGTFGDYGIFSFNGNKIITTSGGGMLISQDPEKIQKVRKWATQSRDPARHYQHSELGFNYRMSNIAAGIGRGQLKVLDQRVAKKKYIFDYYKKALGDLAGISFMPENHWNEPNYWLTCMLLADKSLPDKIMDALEAENIEARPIWKPMHLQPYFEKYDFVTATSEAGVGKGAEQADGSVARELFEHGVCLPSDTKMTDEDLDRVCGIIRKVLQSG